MKLKRNLLTILYAALFLLVMGVVLFQIFYLTFVTSSTNYMIVGLIVVLAISIYLILAYFIKEKGSFQRLEETRVLPVLLECFVTVGCVGTLFVLRYEDGLQLAILHSAFLLILASVGRFLLGRINGIMTTLFAFLLVFFNATSLDANSIIQLLAFLVPYAMFLCVSRYITKNGLLLILSYIMLGFVYASAIVINPLVLLLFAGCVLSLLFGKAEGKASVLAKGPMCAGFLILFTGILLCVAYFVIPDMFVIPKLQIDSQIPFSKLDSSFVLYFLTKLLKPVQYLMQIYGNGMIATVLIFFAFLSGYYCISRKTSYIGPILFAFLALSGCYLAFSVEGNYFYYLSYFLPLLAGYGISNTLLCDSAQKEEAREELEDMTDHNKDQDQQEQENKGNDRKEEQVNLPELNNKELSKASKATKTNKAGKANKAGKLARGKNTRTGNELGVSPEREDAIPEWTIADDYSEALLEEAGKVPEESVEEKVEDIGQVREEEIGEELEIDGISIEPELSREMLQKDSEEANLSYVDKAEEANLSYVDKTEEANLSHVDKEEDSSSLIETSALVLENNTDITELTHDGSNDYEQFLSEEEGMPLDELLERLDISDNIKRMNEDAREDMADVIERDEEQVELDEALPLKPSKSTLPKYKKPNFDFEMEPVSIPLDDSYSNISEYDEVPTVHDLESKWKSKENTVIETVATPIEEESGHWEDTSPIINIHSDEIVKKSGSSKRSYHRITIR